MRETGREGLTALFSQKHNNGNKAVSYFHRSKHFRFA